ncbi:uncharacterized protein UDID_19435 [Ustilago sp. UG-2017a]|nr:uncharacterized protein UDID_19435 [Ustilago sp. UG-2017a]
MVAFGSAFDEIESPNLSSVSPEVALTAFSYKVRVVVQNLSSGLGDEKTIEALVINRSDTPARFIQAHLREQYGPYHKSRNAMEAKQNKRTPRALSRPLQLKEATFFHHQYLPAKATLRSASTFKPPLVQP